jgi:hypothetical protein
MHNGKTLTEATRNQAALGVKPHFADNDPLKPAS